MENPAAVTFETAPWEAEMTLVSLVPGLGDVLCARQRSR